MKPSVPPTDDDQVRILADHYTQRADAYDRLWSPVIQPFGERLLQQLPLAHAGRIVDVGAGAGALLPAIRQAAPAATVVGIDRSLGMLNVARLKHRGPLAVMDAQQLGLPDAEFDVAVAAFILFHLPHPERCLREIWRVLRPSGAVGIVTWAWEDPPFANSIWDEELTAAGAKAVELPATDNRSSCNSTDKVATLFEEARFEGTAVSTQQIEHRWPPPDHFEWHVRSTSRMRLLSLGDEDREACLRRIRDRLAGLDEDQHTFRGEVVVATAVRPSAGLAAAGAAAEDSGVVAPEGGSQIVLLGS